jgi:hypothetical protein
MWKNPNAGFGSHVRNAELHAASIRKQHDHFEDEFVRLKKAAAPFVNDSVRLKFMGDRDGRIYLSVTAEEYKALSELLKK